MMGSNDFDKEEFIKEVAKRLNIIAQICEENDVGSLNLRVNNGYYSFFSLCPDISFKAYTDKRKQQDAEFEEKLKIYSELGIPLDKNIEEFDCACEDDWEDYEEIGGVKDV